MTSFCFLSARWNGSDRWFKASDHRCDTSQSTQNGASLLKKGLFPIIPDGQKGDLNSKLHAVCDGKGRPVRLHLTAGQVSDCRGADVLLADMPEETKRIIGDRGYDSNTSGSLTHHAGNSGPDFHIPCRINLSGGCVLSPDTSHHVLPHFCNSTSRTRPAGQGMTSWPACGEPAVSAIRISPSRMPRAAKVAPRTRTG